MDVFDWIDLRDNRRWRVVVTQRGFGARMPPAGHVLVAFQSDGDSAEIASPFHPEPGDLGVLQDLLDWAIEGRAF